MIARTQDPLSRRLVDSLYMEAMLLADEARSYFDINGRADRDALSPIDRVGFSCESLRVTTRLMHIIAWLLTRRAVAAGEISEAQGGAPERRLGQSQESDPEMATGLPETARQLIAATGDLHARVLRLDERLGRPETVESPARSLMRRLEGAF